MSLELVAPLPIQSEDSGQVHASSGGWWLHEGDYVATKLRDACLEISSAARTWRYSMSSIAKSLDTSRRSKLNHRGDDRQPFL